MKGRVYQNKGGFVVRFGRDVSKWFKHRYMAERFLTGLRYEVDKGTFDIRDYQKDKPLAFSTLSKQYLKHKKMTVKRRSYNNLKRYMTLAGDAWGDANIKKIGYAEIEDLLFEQPVSDKTRSNMRSCLHDFWMWLRRRRVITLAQVPEFPTINFELGWRTIIDIETQQRIVQEVYRISHDVNIKIWLGIKWLSTYISMRPGEMLALKESHVDARQGTLIIPHPKEKKPKIIFLTEDDAELLRELLRNSKGLPDLHFFRHGKGIQSVKPGSKFGQRYLYKWWKKACANLGIEGVDLYGGTRHSTATALGEVMTPEQIKTGTMHTTNKAFDRYYQGKARDARRVYSAVQNLQQTYNQKEDKERGKVLKFKE